MTPWGWGITGNDVDSPDKRGWHVAAAIRNDHHTKKDIKIVSMRHPSAENGKLDDTHGSPCTATGTKLHNRAEPIHWHGGPWRASSQ
jgi:hypothetical protein